MRKIVYYLASSIDGFISGNDNNVSGFVSEGTGKFYGIWRLKMGYRK